MTVLAPSTRAADLLRGPPRRSQGDAEPARGGRGRPGRPDLAPLADGRAGRRAREPRARARAGPLRRRPRLRARAPLALLPGAARHRRARRSRPSARPTGSRYPPARSQREKLLARLDALLALSRAGRDAAARALPRRLPRRLARRRPRALRAGGRSAADHVVELRPNERAVARARDARRCASCPAGRRCCCARRPLVGAPGDPARPRRPRPACAPRATAPRARAILHEAAIFVPGRRRAGARSLLEAQAAGCAIAAPRGLDEQPELAAAAAARLAEDDELPRRASRRERAREAEPPVVRRASPAELDELYAGLSAAPPARPRRTRRPARRPALDRRRPAHAHLLVVRLRVDAGRARRPRRCRGARRDRGHRPQRLRRRARDGRGGARPRPDRHPGRGGQDRRARAR